MLITILIFFIILGLLVFVHEFGHFVKAKRSGMEVREFGFGFSPRIIGLTKIDGKWKVLLGRKVPENHEGTIYSINLIPLGGFVRIVGENNEELENPKSFVNRSFLQRLATLLAGVVMNVVLAWVLFSVGFMFGLPVAVDNRSDVPSGGHLTEPQVTIGEVVKNSPAEHAGLRGYDVIVAVNGVTAETTEQLRDWILSHKGQALEFTIKRAEQEEQIVVNSEANPQNGQGPTGIVLLEVGRLSFPWYLAITKGLQATLTQFANIATGFWLLLSGGIGLENLGGPAKIAQLTGQVAGLGFVYLIQFTAFLSLNLAFLNSLPFPALDGGRVLFLIIEKIRGVRNNQNIEQWFNAVGFFALLLLMLAVTINDIRSFGGLGHVLSKLIGG